MVYLFPARGQLLKLHFRRQLIGIADLPRRGEIQESLLGICKLIQDPIALPRVLR